MPITFAEKATGEHLAPSSGARDVRRRTTDAPAPAKPADGATPMMAQYLAIKAENPDCLLFYRMGDFYELFFDDAVLASRVLGIVLTKRGKHLGDEIPMCGVPIERGDDALARLIAAGHRVAVCEQTEDPAEAKKRGGRSVVSRAVVRLVTAGTLTEDRLLDPARPNLLAAVSRRRDPGGGWRFGLAHLDISTGRFGVAESDRDGLAAAIARLEPRELVLPDVLHDDEGLRPLWRDLGISVSPTPRDGLDADGAARRICAHFGVATLDGFGAFTPAEVAAAGAALAYVERTQLGARPALSPPVREEGGSTLAIDPATRANLELARSAGGGRDGGLLSCIDRTATAAGARLLAERLGGPLTDAEAIRARHDAVERLLADRPLRERLRAVLAGCPDVPRALSRLTLGRGGPRDLACLRDGLVAAADLGAILTVVPELPDELARAARDLAAPDPAVMGELGAALAESLPLSRREGGFIREGHDAALDEARLLATDSRRVIAALGGRYVAETGCRTLRIKHNGQLGYFVEVPSAAGEAFLRSGPFVHRQTMAGAMRFTTVELGELEARIASAGERALRIELAHFERLASRVVAAAGPIGAAAAAVAAVDVSAGLAELAAEGGWTRPVVSDGLAFRIEGGRHPVVEAALRREGQPFIANNCDLGPPEGPGRIMLVTGPNMGGKSTFLRQSALLVVLAQMGSFVPADRAEIGVVDRLYSRVGAADDLARGRSTFMVEMVETAAILHGATARSLVILDEVGRGTATFDGLSIAWATIEHLHEATRCRALFATHFHELTALGRRLPRLANATLRVAEHEGEVVFLHEVAPGAADRSYGLQVARLAGLPASVVDRARAILGELERRDRERPGTAPLNELPLFAAAAARPPEPASPDRTPAERFDPLREALSRIEPDDLTPREALDTLYRLRRLAADEG